jgi:hypothetical protein
MAKKNPITSAVALRAVATRFRNLAELSSSKAERKELLARAEDAEQRSNDPRAQRRNGVDRKVALRGVATRFRKAADEASSKAEKAELIAKAEKAEADLAAVVAREIELSARAHRAVATRIENQAKAARGKSRAALIELAAAHREKGEAVSV